MMGKRSAVFGALLLLLPVPAWSCMPPPTGYFPGNLPLILDADAVVIGELKDYRLVPGENSRRPVALFSVKPETASDVLFARPGIPIAPGAPLHIYWAQQNIGMPSELSGMTGEKFMVALIVRGQKAGNGASAQSQGLPDYELMSFPCSPAFLFRMIDLRALALRQALTTDRDREQELEILSEFLDEGGALRAIQDQVTAEGRRLREQDQERRNSYDKRRGVEGFPD